MENGPRGICRAYTKKRSTLEVKNLAIKEKIVSIEKGSKIKNDISLPPKVYPVYHKDLFLAAILLPLFQEGQLSVTGESMCTKYWLTA